MKSKNHFFSRFTSRRFVSRIRGRARLVAILVLAGAGTSHALVWTGPGGLTTAPAGGNWDTTTINLWTATTGAGNVAWSAGPADFGGAGGPITVTLTTGIPNVTNLNFNSTGYTLAATGGLRDVTLSGNLNVATTATAIIENNVNIQKTTGSLAIGTAGAAGGTLTIKSGGTVKATAGGNNTATYIQGTGTVVNVNGTLARTSNTNSSSAASGDATHIGNNALDNVTVNVNTGGTYSSGGRTFRIGSAGTAKINVNGGTFSMLSNSTQGHVYIGYGAGTSTVSVNGGSFSTNPGNPGAGTGQLVMGLIPTSIATLDVTDGTVNAYGRMVLGVGSTNAKVNLSGTGSIIVGNTGLTISESTAPDAATAAGTFNLNGGTLTTSAVTKGLGTATFNFNGGVLKASTANAAFMTGLTTANVHDNGAIIHTNGFNVTIAQDLTHSVLPAANAIDGGLTKNGTGALSLTGTGNTYTGLTTINAGTLTLDNISLANQSGSTIGVNGTLRAKGSIAVAGTLSSQGAVDLTDGTANTLAVGSTVALTSSSINVELLTGSADQISATGAATVSGTNIVNVSLASGETLTTGDYTILSTAGGLNASAFTIGARPPGFNQLTLSTPTANALVLSVVAGGNPTPSTAYWTGLASSTGSPANPTNLWGYGADLSPAKSNWSTTANGLNDPLQVPGETTNVILTASNATHDAGILTTKLGANYAINGLTFDVPGSTGITSTFIDTNTSSLAIGAGGLIIGSGSSSVATINGNGAVRLSSDFSTWSNQSHTKTLNVTVPISPSLAGSNVLILDGTGTGGMTLTGGIGNGPGTLALFLDSAGLITLGGACTYTGVTEVNSGKLLLENPSSFTSKLVLTGVLSDAVTFHQETNNVALPNASITGEGGIVKSGAASLTLSNGSSTYSGGTTVNGGTLLVNSSTGQGTDSGQACTVGLMDPANRVTVNNGGTLAINGTAPLGNSDFLPEFSPSVEVNAGGTISGGAFVAFLPNLTLNGGTIHIGNGNTTGGFNTNLGLAGTVIVGGSFPSNISTTGTGGNANASLGSNAANAAAGVTFQVANVTGDAAADLTVSSVLRNHKAVASGLIKDGPGSMLLSAANTYTGSTTVSAGALILGSAFLSDSAGVSIGASATLNLTHGALDTVNALTIGGVQMAAGTYGPAGIANSHITGTGSLVVTTGPVAGYDSWSLVIPDAADRDRADDPDTDGFNNITEYLFGTSPIASNGSLTQSTKSGSNLIVRWSQRNAGTFVLQESSTLLNPWPASGVPVNNSSDQTGLYSADYTRKEAIVPIDNPRKLVRVQGAE